MSGRSLTSEEKATIAYALRELANKRQEQAVDNGSRDFTEANELRDLANRVISQ